jgi:hypothetical protein
MYVDVIKVYLCIDFTIFRVIPEYLLKKYQVKPANSETTWDQYFSFEKKFLFIEVSVANQSVTLSSEVHHGLN